MLYGESHISRFINKVFAGPTFPIAETFFLHVTRRAVTLFFFRADLDHWAGTSGFPVPFFP